MLEILWGEAKVDAAGYLARVGGRGPQLTDAMTHALARRPAVRPRRAARCATGSSAPPTARGLVEDGLPLPGDAEYWRRRAAGGAAMLTVGGTVTAPESTWRRRITTEAWRPEAVPGMAARAEAIRAEGAVAACQLVHLGRETTGAGEWYHPVAPSAVRSPREPTRPRALSDGEVDAVVEGFRRLGGATRREAGFQVVELHAAHGYLLAQFLSRGDEPPAGADGRRRRADRRARSSAAIRVVGARGRRRHPAVDRRRGGGGLSLEGCASCCPHVDALVDYVNLTVGVRTTYVRDMATRGAAAAARTSAQLRALVDAPAAGLAGLPHAATRSRRRSPPAPISSAWRGR